jgi:hypothetical protein
MNDSYEQLRHQYIETLRSVTPAIIRWWNDHCPYPWTDPVPREAMTDFHRRWPVGPAAHPRIIAVFRQYFFAVEELNQRSAAEDDAHTDENMEVWGKDVKPAMRSQVRPIDLLVNDLATIAPDLFEIMQGLVFVPIGMDPDGEVS